MASQISTSVSLPPKIWVQGDCTAPNFQPERDKYKVLYSLRLTVA